MAENVDNEEVVMFDNEEVVMLVRVRDGKLRVDLSVPKKPTEKTISDFSLLVRFVETGEVVIDMFDIIKKYAKAHPELHDLIKTHYKENKMEMNHMNDIPMVPPEEVFRMPRR